MAAVFNVWGLRNIRIFSNIRKRKQSKEETYMSDKYDALKLEHQICFPLYAASREIVKMYTPFLSRIDLTYTQYITMMVMWEHRCISARKMGELLFLDSGTLTPVLKALEKKGYVVRERSHEDERVLMVTITEEGMALREKAVEIPHQVGSCVQLEAAEAADLYRLLYKVLGRTE